MNDKQFFSQTQRECPILHHHALTNPQIHKFLLIIVSGVSRRRDTEQTKKSKLLVKKVTDLNTIQWKEHWKGGREECDWDQNRLRRKKKTTLKPWAAQIPVIQNYTKSWTMLNALLYFWLYLCVLVLWVQQYICSSSQKTHTTHEQISICLQDQHDICEKVQYCGPGC